MFDTLYIVLIYAGWAVLFLSILLGVLGLAAFFGVMRYQPAGDDALSEYDYDFPGDRADVEPDERAGRRRAARVAAE